MKYNNEMTLTVKALSQNEAFARSVASAFFAQLNPTVEQLEDFKTAVSEAVTNSVVHAYEKSAGTIELWAGLTDNAIYIKIKDRGVGIDDVAKAMQPFFTTGQERSGMGFTVMQAFSDKLEMESQKGYTCISMVKYADAGKCR